MPIELQANCAVEATIDECLRQLTAVANAARRRAARRARAAGAEGLLGVHELPAGTPTAPLCQLSGCSVWLAKRLACTRLCLMHTTSLSPIHCAAAANGSEAGGGMRRGIPSWVHMPSLGLPYSESKEALQVCGEQPCPAPLSGRGACLVWACSL